MKTGCASFDLSWHLQTFPSTLNTCISNLPSIYIPIPCYDDSAIGMYANEQSAGSFWILISCLSGDQMLKSKPTVSSRSIAKYEITLGDVGIYQILGSLI